MKAKRNKQNKNEIIFESKKKKENAKFMQSLYNILEFMFYVFLKECQNVH